MKLLRFQVVGFRSVEDSGWIEAGNVTSLIGTNESGKSNLLAPLWKLNPAKGGEINPITDYPRTRFNQIRSMEDKPIFIRACFEIETKLAKILSEKTGYPENVFKEAEVSKDFDNNIDVIFPGIAPITTIASDAVLLELSNRLASISTLEEVNEADKALKIMAISTLNEALVAIRPLALIDKILLKTIHENFEKIKIESIENSAIVPALTQIKTEINTFVKKVSLLHPSNSKSANDLIVESIPKFVYYSNYGNLDSEIYLPHVTVNLKRTDLGPKEEAKARTLRVLFDFVKLDATEIQSLGSEQGGVDPKHIEIMSEKKKEREILLQSASSYLTEEFRKWWKQGNYRFRFAADGNFFKIWVSDDKRPEEIELEGRSTGLQWFLSFFLVFLVEAKDAHSGAILLLDEPGLTLHPLAQRDLSSFFEGLSLENQLIFSTHSPFLIDSDKLDQVRAVYIDEKGRTSVTSDLRSAAPKQLQSNSIFAAHAALGLTVSDVILQGCQAVLVEGVSDQIYFSALKTHLISTGVITPKKEIIFIPTGGTKAIKSVAAILTAKEEELPFVILDSDKNGLGMEESLKSDLYKTQPGKVIMIGNLTGMQNSETEDLFPATTLTDLFSRQIKVYDDEDQRVFDDSKPCISQFESFATKAGVTLEKGWKVDLAKAMRRKISSAPTVLADWRHDETCTQLFTLLITEKTTEAPTEKTTKPKTSVKVRVKP